MMWTLAQTDTPQRTLMDRLLGLEGFSWADENTVISWQHVLPAWAWALIVLGAIAFAGWSYYNLMGIRWGRTALAVVRTVLIVLIAMLLAGPMLVLKRERIEPDVVLVLVDRSASMQIRDMQEPPAGAETRRTWISRDQALRQVLQTNGELFGPGKIANAHRQIIWLGFDGQTFDVQGPGGGPLDDAEGTSSDPASASQTDTQAEDIRDALNASFATQWAEPQGQTTALRTAIDQGLQKAAGRPIAGIVLFTDGRSPEATGSDLVRRLNQQGAGIFAIPLGASEMPLDLAIARVDHPEKAFVNDVVPITVYVEAYGQTGDIDPSRITVQLLDENTGQVLDSKNGTPINQPVRLSTQSQTVGQVKWRVEVSYDGQSQDSEEIITENNAQSLALELVDRPIRVLLVDAYPRWEFRYLRNMLIREESIDSSTLLLSADSRFAQEGDSPITRMPSDSKEIEPYDVIMIGDVPSRYFGADLMSLIRDHVAVRGAGLVWIGGEHFTPRSYETTALADLLPMRLPAAVTRLDPTLGQVAMRPTPLAQSLNVLQIRALNAAADDTSTNWPEELSPLRWVQDLGPLKPTTEVLAESQLISELSSAIPMVVRMRFGGGQVIYVATDEIWRWRYGRGEIYFEQFWIQLLRMQARNRLQQDRGAVRLAVSHPQVQRDRAVVVEMTLNDEMLLKRDLNTVAVAVQDTARPDAGAVESLELQAVGGSEEAGLAADDPMTVTAGRRYRAVWRPSITGNLRLNVIEPGMLDLDIHTTLDVFHPDDEKRQPMPDHDRLQTLAQQTEGRVVPLDELATLGEAGVIPNRQRRSENDIRETIWDSWLALILVVALLTVEWVGRKAIRLV